LTAPPKRARRDETVVDLLMAAGVPRNLAKTLVFLARRDETISVDIEKATGLRQPEVSLAMRELRTRRWVEKRDIKREGKGRPVHGYRLTVPFETIVDSITREERRKIQSIEDTLKRLKGAL